MKKKILISLLVSLLLVCAVAVGIFATDSTTTEETFRVYKADLTFGVDLRFNIKVQTGTLPEGVTASDVKLLVWEGDVTVEDASAETNYTKNMEGYTYTELTNPVTDANGLLVFTYDGITAAEMGKTLYLRAYYNDGTKDVYTTAKRYSMAQYLHSIYKAEGTTEKENEVIESLFAYGDAAQELVLNPNDELTLPKISDGVVKITVTNGTFADGFTEGKFLAGEKLSVVADSEETAPTLTSELGSGFLWTTKVDEVTNYSDEATVAYSDGIYVGKYANAFKVTVGETSTIYTDKTLAEAVELANGGTLMLLGNVDLGADCLSISSEIYNPDTSLTVATEVTLDLNGYEIKSSYNQCTIENHGNLTIEDNSNAKTGKITATGSAVFVYGGTVTITGGTVTGNYAAVNADGGEVEISGGTFTGDNYVVYVMGGEVTISGGTFTGDVYAVYVGSVSGTVTISGGTFDGALYNGDTLNITGGTFSEDPSDYVDTTAYTVTVNEDGTYTVTATNAGGEGEAEGTDSESTTLTGYAAEVQTALNAGDTVTLTENVDLGEACLTIPEGITVTLDLNGYEITSSGSWTIDNIGNLTVTDGSTNGTGKITNTATTDGTGIYNSNISGVALTIEGGTITSNSYNVHNNAVTVTIKGGTFSSNSNNIYNDNGTVTITGGTFNTDPSAYVNTEAYDVTQSDGTYTVAAKAQ